MGNLRGALPGRETVINGRAKTNLVNSCAGDSTAAEGGAIGYYGGNDDNAAANYGAYANIPKTNTWTRLEKGWTVAAGDVTNATTFFHLKFQLYGDNAAGGIGGAGVPAAGFSIGDIFVFKAPAADATACPTQAQFDQLVAGTNSLPVSCAAPTGNCVKSSVAVVPAAMGWSDLGSWDALHAIGSRDEADNLSEGEVKALDSRNCLFKSTGPRIAAIGVSDLIVVATGDTVLIAPRGRSQDVRRLAGQESPSATREAAKAGDKADAASDHAEAKADKSDAKADQVADAVAGQDAAQIDSAAQAAAAAALIAAMAAPVQAPVQTQALAETAEPVVETSAVTTQAAPVLAAVAEAAVETPTPAKPAEQAAATPAQASAPAPTTAEDVSKVATAAVVPAEGVAVDAAALEAFAKLASDDATPTIAVADQPAADAPAAPATPAKTAEASKSPVETSKAAVAQASVPAPAPAAAPVAPAVTPEAAPVAAEAAVAAQIVAEATEATEAAPVAKPVEPAKAAAPQQVQAQAAGAVPVETAQAVTAAASADAANTGDAGGDAKTSNAANAVVVEASAQASAPVPAVAPPPVTTAPAVSASTQAAAPAPVRGSPETVAALSAEIVKKADAKTTRFDVALTPDGLGKVDVRIEIARDGALTASMRFDTAHAAQELRNKAGELRQALADAGFNVADNALSFDVSSQNNGQNPNPFFAFDGWSDQGQRAFSGRAFQAAMTAEEEIVVTPSDLLPGLKTAADSGLDIRI